MTVRYRSENGKLAKGVKKQFSEATLAVLRDRLAKARQAEAQRRQSLKNRLERNREAQAAYVKAMAASGKFVPVADFE